MDIFFFSPIWGSRLFNFYDQIHRTLLGQRRLILRWLIDSVINHCTAKIKIKFCEPNKKKKKNSLQNGRKLDGLFLNMVVLWLSNMAESELFTFLQKNSLKRRLRCPVKVHTFEYVIIWCDIIAPNCTL